MFCIMSPFEHVLIDKFFFPSREERNCEHVFENDETLFQALGSRAKQKKKMLHYVSLTFPVLDLHLRGCHVSLHHTAGSESGHLARGIPSLLACDLLTCITRGSLRSRAPFWFLTVFPTHAMLLLT